MKVAKQVFVLMAGIFGTTVVLADFDGSDPLICSFGQIIECDLGAECRAVTNESIDAPDFVRLDFKKKKVVAIAAGQEGTPDDIDNVTELENQLVVQGVQGNSSTDALGWTASINQTTGQMVVTGSGDNAGFVVFGACMPL